MTPKIIHQTWRDHDLPVDAALPDSWKRHNPDWEYRFWTDEDLNRFVQTEYPEMLALYMDVPRPVQRADIARYLLLHKYGGIYADIDTECHAPANILAGETRVILSEEPREHWTAEHACFRDMGVMVFNGTMASPAGHPFWKHVMTVLQRTRHAQKDVLESTGPLMLSGAVLNYPDQSAISINSCHLFNPQTKGGTPSKDPEFGPYARARISTHLWAGTWVNSHPPRLRHKIKAAFHTLRAKWTRGAYLSTEAAKAAVDLSRLRSPLPTDPALPDIAVLIPLRDAEPYLERCFALLDALEYPKERLKLVFCEGDSADNTVERLHRLVDARRHLYLNIEILHFASNVHIPRKIRWKPKFQKKRRGALARVRNYLVEKGLGEQDEWALWIDVDVCDYPSDTLHSLLAAKAKIVTPDCVLEPGGSSYDMNSFLDVGDPRGAGFHRHISKGLFQPPDDYYWRRHLHDLRYLDRVPLSAVGGTMLLVHGSVHRSGVHFTEVPYDYLLETESFGKMARDLGVTPVGLPNVEIRHVKA